MKPVLTHYLTFLALFFSIETMAITKTFTGASGGNWTVAANWSPSGVPADGDDVIIPDNITVNITTNIGPEPRSITINGTLNFTNNGKLTVTSVVYINPATGGAANGDSNNDKFTINGVTYSGNEIDGLSGQIGVIPSPFPVKLIDFKAHVSNHTVNLKWFTKEEVGFDRFYIEKSSNALSFEGIGYLSTNPEKNYLFIDDAPKMGNNYYRLKMVDLDGSFEFSKIIVAYVSGENSSVIFPNPSADGQIQIVDIKNYDDIKLSTLSGQSVEYRIQFFGNNGILLPLLSEGCKELVLTANFKHQRITKRIVML
jgi:G8 domain